MFNTWVRFTVVGMVLCQASPTPTARIGPTGAFISIDDLNQIAKVACGDGAGVWLLEGPKPGWIASKRWFVNAYCRADRVTAALRRGRMDTVTADLPTIGAYASPKTWQNLMTMP
jgi:hypothetical protein